MVDFTDKGQVKSYQATSTQGVTSKEGLVKPGIVGDIAKSLSLGIDIGTELDKQSVVREATKAAEEISNQYMASSPTNINFLQSEKVRLEGEMPGASETEQNNITNQINSINEQLTLANSQGYMSTSEALLRSNAKAREIASRNPAYRGQIAAAMDNYYASMGVKQMMDFDQKLFNKQAALAEKRYTKMFDLVAKYDGNVMYYDDDQLATAYRHYATVEGTKEQYKVINERAKEWNKLTKNEQLQAMGGYDKLPETKSAIYQTLVDELARVLDRNDLDFNQKKQLGLDTIEQHKNKFEAATYKFYDKEDQVIERFTSQMDSMFANMTSQFKDDITGKDFTAKMNNDRGVLEASLDIQALNEHGITKNGIEYAKLLTELYGKLKTSGMNLPNNTTLMKETEGLLNDVVLNRWDTSNMSRDAKQVIGKNKGKNYNEVVKGVIKTLPADTTANNNEVPQATENIVNNQLAWVNSLQGSTIDKVQALDMVMLNQIKIPNDQFKELYKRPGFYQSFNESMRTYGGFAVRALSDMKELSPDLFTEAPIKIYDNGTIRSDNFEIDKQLERVNNYVTLKAKANQQNPIDVLNDALTKEFSFLQVPGYEAAQKPVQIRTEADLKALPSGTQYKDVDGTMKVKP